MIPLVKIIALLSEIIDQVTELVRTLISRGNELVAVRDGQPVTTPRQLFRRLFKKAYPKARAQATSRVAMEWMVSKVCTMTGSDVAGLPYRDVDALYDASDCNQLTPNCSSPSVDKYRTIDGSCNNPFHPTLGAAFTPFRRLLDAAYEDGICQPVGFYQNYILKKPFSRGKPSPRLISLQVVRDIIVDQPQATLMLMQWGQFLDHDYASLMEGSAVEEEEIECNTCTQKRECVPIPVPSNDPQFGVGTIQNGNCLSFTRSGVSCLKPTGGVRYGPRQQLNQITHWVDASNVYGSQPEDEKELRAFHHGLLKEGKVPNTLPADLQGDCPGSTPCFRAGDFRVNEQVALTVMHTIFMREHNRIAKKLQRLNPSWNDEKIYQETRKIVGAEAQVITFQEYLPEILGVTNTRYLLGPYTGYNPYIDGSLPNSFATAAFRMGHSQIQPEFLLIDENGRSLPPLRLVDAFFKPQAFFDNGGTDPFLRGLLSQQSRKVDSFLSLVLTNRLFEKPGMAGMDLASLNIHRGRDHGLPSYGAFRNYCTSKFGYHFWGYISDQSVHRKLLELYGSEYNIDLWVGGLAEAPLPGARIGPTFACIFAITFKGLRDGDRFYYKNPGVFTAEQLVEIRKASLSKIICDNADNITAVQPNAFSSIQGKRHCNTLPSIDLTKWSEASEVPQSPSDCYIKVQSHSVYSTSSTAVLFTQLTESTTNWVMSDRKTTSPHNSYTKAACLRFTCPPQNAYVKIGVKVYTSSYQCGLQQVVGFLPRGSYGSTSYYAVIQQRFGPSIGVYNNLYECQSGGGSLQFDPIRGAAVMFRCPLYF